MKYISVLILPFVHKKTEIFFISVLTLSERGDLWLMVAFCTKKKNRDNFYLGFNL